MQQFQSLAGNSIKTGNGLSLESVIVLITALIFLGRSVVAHCDEAYAICGMQARE
jgi:hypothetical protein